MSDNGRRIDIYRGLPGAGKTTRASQQPEALVISADDYFMKNGKYCFDKFHLPNAHEQCYQRVQLAMIFDQPHIIVDNTNSRKSEYQKYIDLANQYGYTVYFIDVYDGGCNNAKLVERCTRNGHNVPEYAIANIRTRYER